MLLELLMQARARLVRVWAIELLKREHVDALARIAVDVLLRLLDHSDEQIQLLGAELLEKSTELAKLPISTWLTLLNTRNPTALETICQLMARHVHSDRLDLTQCVALACAKPSPVARLGFTFLRDREIRDEPQRQIIADLANARAASLGRELAEWALARLGAGEAYQTDRIARFFDSLLREVREGAWAWLKPETRGWDDVELWGRLTETPYDDVRLYFVSALQQRATAPGLGAENLSALWCAVLLGIHRGGRHKLIALRQISEAVRDRPESAETLLPVLAVAIRSVRPPEVRAGLAAIVSAIDSRPELADLIARHLPELQFVPEASPEPSRRGAAR